MTSFLNGYKTFITAGAAGLVLALQQLGILTEEQGKTLLEGLGVLLMVFLRMGVATATKVAATTLAVTTGTVSANEGRAVSVANPPPVPPREA